MAAPSSLRCPATGRKLVKSMPAGIRPASGDGGDVDPQVGKGGKHWPAAEAAGQCSMTVDLNCWSGYMALLAAAFL